MLTKEFIITFFKQGLVRKGGNCASIALIKTALGQFGFDIFFLKKEFGSYRVTLKNGKSYNITVEELAMANDLNGFIFQGADQQSKEYFDYAQLAFAVMCKVCEKERYHKNFRAAIIDLNRGENTDFIKELLGLESFYSIPLENGNDIGHEDFENIISKKKNILLYSDAHAVFCSEGVYDDHGIIESTNNEDYDFIYLQEPN